MLVFRGVGIYARIGKRPIDVAIAGLALGASTPLLLSAALAVRTSSAGPVFFGQRRAGRAGQEFTLLKLRTMVVHDRDPMTMNRSDESELVTGVGRFLRRFKVDELPQLINVLRGDMSLIGPRPTLPELARDYSATQRRRLLVRPGLTGWAQVNGNTSLSWDERIALDLWYVDHMSSWLDLRILLRTLAVVIAGEHRREEALRRARSVPR